MDLHHLAAPQKKARRLHGLIVFIDESGLLLMPTIRRSLALKGHTPVLTHRARHRDKVSMGAALCVNPKSYRARLITAMYPNQYINSARTAVFLRMLAAKLRRPLIVVWDRGQMHKGDVIREVLQQCPRLFLEFLPPYAPQLNPVEALWNHVKADVLANFTPKTVAEIVRQLGPLIDRVQKDQKRLQSFLAATPLFGGAHYLGEPQ